QLRRARRRAAELDREPESGGGALLWRRRRARLRARARDARRPARAARARRRAETFPRSCDRLRDCGYHVVGVPRLYGVRTALIRKRSLSPFSPLLMLTAVTLLTGLSLALAAALIAASRWLPERGDDG